MNFDLLEVLAGRRLRSLRKTNELTGVAALQIGTGLRWNENVELVEVSIHREDLTTLGTHIVPLVLQDLHDEIAVGQ